VFANKIAQIDFVFVTLGTLALIMEHFVLHSCLTMTHLVATNLTLVTAIFFIVPYGIFLFFTKPGPGQATLLTEYDSDILILSQMMLVYQIYNLMATTKVKELQTIQMIGHHIVVILLAIASFLPFGLGYIPYCFGVVEISNIPLTILEILDTVNDEQKSKFHALKMISGGFFILTYFMTRVIGWIIVSYLFYSQALTFLFAGESETILKFGNVTLKTNHIEVSEEATFHALESAVRYAIYLFIFANTTLGFLQIKWAFQILMKARETLTKRAVSPKIPD
jgi:hypothetical protein